MATAAKPRAMARIHMGPVGTLTNTCEPDDPPDVTFQAHARAEGAGDVGFSEVEATFTIWPDEGEQGYLGFTTYGNGVQRLDIDVGDITAEEVRLLAAVLGALAERTEKELPAQIARIRHDHAKL